MFRPLLCLSGWELVYSARLVLLGLLKTMRPHQWVKNLFVILPVVFAQDLFEDGDPTAGPSAAALRSLAGFVLFCLASGTVYILNDLVDIEGDRAHPTKRNRPIASGRVSSHFARGAAMVVLGTALVGAGLLDLTFLAVIAGYFTLNVAYSLRLKQVAYLDVFCIAAGFELRVVGGALVAPVPPSAYLLVVTALLALFLGFGKRLHELMQGDGAHEQRAVLRAYNIGVVTAFMYVTAIATISTYAVYTFDPRIQAALGTAFLPVTTLFTLFGVLRFLSLARKPEPQSPTDRMLRDLPFLINLLAWAVSVVVLVYLGA